MSPLFLLPGLDATGRLYADFEAALRVGRGFTAMSYPADQPLDYDGLAPLVREALPTEGPWVLIGESFSGPLAIRIATEQPAGLAAVVLCATFARRPFPIPSGLVPTLAFRVPAPHWVMRRLMFERGAPAEAVAEFMDALGGVAPEVLAARARAALAVDVVERLGEIDVPVLYLRAGADGLFSARVEAVVRDALPSMQTTVIEGAPHLLLQRRPADAAAAIEAWLGEVID